MIYVQLDRLVASAADATDLARVIRLLYHKKPHAGTNRPSSFLEPRLLASVKSSIIKSFH